MFKENTFYIIKEKIWLCNDDEDFCFRKDEIIYVVDVSMPFNAFVRGIKDVLTPVRVVHRLQTLDLIIYKSEIDHRESKMGYSFFEEVVES